MLNKDWAMCWVERERERRASRYKAECLVLFREGREIGVGLQCKKILSPGQELTS